VTHRIIIVENGTGPGGSASSTVEYTPNHAVPGAQQIRKAEKAAKVLEKLNDYLYGSGPDPYPDE